MKMLKVTDHGETRYVPDYDDGDDTDHSTAIVKSINPEAITRDAMAQNSAMVANLLKQFAPQIDAPTGYRNPHVSGIASPAELASRNERFKWTIIAVVVLSAITAAGIVLVAQRQMGLDTVATIAGWLVLSGLGGYASATWVHSRESALTPEALEGERIAGDYDIAAVDAESRQIIARAFAKSIENDSETKRLNSEAQRLANLSLLERSKPQEAPQRARAMVYDQIDDYADETPVCAPVAPSVATWELAQDEGFQPIKPAQPSEALRNLLQAVREIYADCERRNSDTITTRLPWSARGEWAARDKERARAVLESFDPALIEAGDGGRYRLNRQWSQADAELMILNSWR